MRLVPEQSPFPRLLVIPVGIILVFGAYLAHTCASALHEAAHCRFRDLTTLPCPTCGGTLAAVSLARGEILVALEASPVVALALVWLVFWVIWGLTATMVPRWRRQVKLFSGEKLGVRIAVGTAILLGWAYQFIRIY